MSINPETLWCTAWISCSKVKLQCVKGLIEKYWAWGNAAIQQVWTYIHKKWHMKVWGLRIWKVKDISVRKRWRVERQFQHFLCYEWEMFDKIEKRVQIEYFEISPNAAEHWSRFEASSFTCGEVVGSETSEGCVTIFKVEWRLCERDQSLSFLWTFRSFPVEAEAAVEEVEEGVRRSFPRLPWSSPTRRALTSPTLLFVLVHLTSGLWGSCFVMMPLQS